MSDNEPRPYPIAVIECRSTYAHRNWVLSPSGIAPTVMANWGFKSPPPCIPAPIPKQCILVATLDKEHYRITEMHRRVYSAEGISPTVNAHHNSPLILVVDDDPD